MAKQLNVNLAFTADTSKAKSQLQDLQNQLSKLTSAPAQQLNLKWTEEIQEATTAAMELKTHLQNATNVQTGNLDFTKLNSSIKQSGKSLSEYGRQLQSLGPAGQQAFMSLASAVAQSEIPIRRSNAALREMMTTLKNTARWQLSSSMLHGFMGAIQGAYRYAQDLNASLNDIRIVTGQNIEQMAKFAESANKAARTLSTTTTDYTNASLIYYQQGLSDAEVAKRTEVTVKMANASGQTAQIVSDQMTAVWNNFYDGSKSLEYYADVMTALGAATASSADEIAGGLEKFAAIGDTIGLSYEYAASALATITSNTRQSEEVVGTALKTIFARIQGLNLGETLDDGTTLNKYSEALQKVGISIFEQSGEIKTMDDILDEMASKWGTLAKDQQIALAQTVAGVRQYTQLVALMDNWNNGDADSMMSNLNTSYNAAGTLQEQADIYAESWEAAQDRVRAAAEGIFSSLIDEDFFIGVLNAFEGILSYVDKTIDSLGGLKGVLSTVGVLMTKVFSDQMAQGLRNMAHNIYMSTEGGRQSVANEKLATMRQMRQDMSLGQEGIGSEVGDVANKQFEQQLLLQEQLMLNSQNMSESEIANAQQLLDLRKQIGEEVVKAKQAEIDAKDKVSNARDKAFVDMGAEADNNDGILGVETTGRFEELQQKMRLVGMTIGDVKAGLQSLDGTLDAAVNPDAVFLLACSFRDGLGKELNMTEQEVNQFFEAINAGGEEAEAALKSLMDKLQSKSGGIQGAMNKELGVGKTAAREMAEGYEQMSSSAYKYKTAAERAAEAQELASKRIKAAKGVVKDWANSIVSSAQGIMSLVSIINAASGAIDTLTNPDATGWEKFFSVLQSGAMILMMSVSMMNSFAQARKNWEKGTLRSAAATLVDAAAESVLAAAKKKTAGAAATKSAAMDKDTADTLENAGANLADAASENANANSKKKTAGEAKNLGAAFKKLGGAAKQWIAANGSMLASAGMIAAAVAIVVGVVAGAVSQYNAQARAAEEAASAAEKVAEAYNTAKSNYEAIASTADAYHSTVESMEEMTKGTNEYNNALMQANDSAMELINHYKDLKYDIEEGLIVIDEESLAEAQREELANVSKMQANTILANSEAKYRANEVDRTQFKRDVKTTSDDDKAVGNGVVTGAAGAAAGALVAAALSGPVGWVAGIVGIVAAVAGGLITKYGTGAQSEEEDKAIDSIAQYVKENGNSMFKDEATFKSVLKDKLKIDDENLVNSLWANNEALQDLTAAEVARLNQEQADWLAAFGLYNQGNEDYANAQNQNYIDNRAAEVREDSGQMAEITSGVEELWKGNNKDFWDAYLTEVLGEESATDGVGENYQIVDMGGGAVTLQKKTAEGAWETVGDKDGLDEDFAQQQLINARVLQKASENIGDYLVDYEALSGQLKTSGIEDQTLIDKILSDYSAGNPIDLSSFAPDIISDIVTGSIINPELRGAVEQAVTEYNKNIPSWWNDLTDEEKAVAWTMDFDDDANIDEVRSAVAAMQSYLDSNVLIAQIHIGDQMEDALESMNWDELHSLFTEAGLTEDQWLEFLGLGSMDAMKQWLADWRSGVREEGDSKSADNVEDAKAYYDTSVSNYEAAKAEREAAEEAQAGTGDTKQDAAEVLTQANTDYETAYTNAFDPTSYYTEADKYMSAVVGPRETEYGVFQDYSFKGLLDYFSNFESDSSEQEALIAEATNLISLAQGLWEYESSGITDKDWTYTAANGQVYTGDDIALAFDTAQTDMAYYMAGYTDINGVVVGGDTEARAAMDLKSEQYGPLGYETLVRSNTWGDSTGQTSSYVYKFFDALIPFLGEASSELADAKAAQESAQTAYDIADEADANASSAVTEATDKEKEAYDTLYGDEGAQARYQAALQADIELQEALRREVEATGLSMEEFQAYKEQIASGKGFENDTGENHAMKWLEELKSTDVAKYNEALNDLAIMQARLARGFKTLGSNWQNWNKVMSNSESSMSEVAALMPEIDGAISDILNWDLEDVKLLPADFYTTNWDVIEDIYNGVDGAVERLAGLATKEYILKMNVDTSAVQTEYDSIMTWLGSMPDLEVGMTLDSTGMTSAFQALLDSGAVTVDQMNDILSNIGFEPEITMTKVETTGNTKDMNGQTYVEVLDPLTGEKHWVTGEYGATGSSIGTTIEIPVINGSSKYSGGGGGGAPAPSNTGGGGGGGGKPKKTSDSRGKKTDIVDRYKQVEDKLDDIRDRMDDASKAADRLWGPARLKQMKAVNDALEEEIDKLKDKRAEADKYLIEDRNTLDDAASDLGISFTYDKSGNISNYEAQMTDVYNQREALLDSFGDEMDEDETERLAEFDKKVEELKSAIAQYDETRELSEDLDNEIQDKINQWQDNNYEQLNYKLEFEIEINDSELELLDYYLGKTEGNIYKTAEAFGYMAGQADIYTDNLKQQEEYVNELNRAYYAGEISMEAYKEGLRNAQSATIENLQALEQQKKAMQEYYGEVMDMALEEISLYTDEMEELNSVLDHYSNILELVGKQEDYATKGKVLQSKATNLRNEMQVQQELYEKSNAEAEKWAAKMATAVEGSNEYETYKKNWIAAQEAANEAQDNMLSKTEEWAEAMKAVVENELAGLAKTMEESLTGGTSFDELLTSMERRSSLQEEYLTTTNQIYETNKLMRQAQQEIDKTTNSVAKRKLANFISETEQMQEQGKLSQYELDIQQAKYDLLLAEIALEEAQSAKSTVRLQRDSEGNFGYVYTADQGAVGEAEQELADKQNALYNLGLEGANDYSQKYAETMQEAQDAITELTQMWMNGEIESEEEYQRRKAEIQDYYYDKLKQYSELYQVALTTDSNVIKDAWSTDFGDMMYKTEDWKVAVDDYFAGAAESMQTWAEVCGTVLDESGLDDVSKKVEDIDNKSNKLKETLIGEDGESGVVGAMMSEVEAAGKLSEAYIGIQNQIDEVIRKYEEMMGIIHEDYTDENTPEVDPAIDPEEEEEDPPEDPEPPEGPAAEGPTYQTGTLTWTGNGASRVWKDSTGKTYKYGSPEQKAIQAAFNRAYSANGGYQGDYWGGWNKLNADVLHKKYGLATGGYTGDWDGSYGKLAFLHQKELVLNANDTENFLQAMDILDKIVSAIDLYSMNSQLGGALSSPSLGNMGGGEVLEQQVHIEASFPGVQDRNEIEEAFNTLINRASQYANRK